MRAPDFWRGDGVLPAVLAPAAALYAAAGALRQALGRPAPSPIPVVCVGNLVAGGAGKTPVALSLAAALAETLGDRVHFVTRGYGGKARGPLRVDPAAHDASAVGDEALLLAAAGPTWIARDRRAGIAAAATAGAALVILDDGFQDPSIVKDLSLLVLDGGYGFGNGRVMPSGPLRESAAAGLARADAVVLVGIDHVGVTDILPSRLPILRARFMPTRGAERLAGKRVFAFAGIGRPEKFFESLLDVGCHLVGTESFPDHHRYRPEEIMRLCELADAADAIPVTTAKDEVRLPPAARLMVQTFPVTIVWQSPDRLRDLLRTLPSRPSLRGERPA